MPRVKTHFKVHASIRNHRHTLGVCEDDALLAMFVRAGLLAIDRYADQTGDSFLVSAADLEWVAGCRGVANARRKLGRLEASSRLTVGQEGAGYRLTIPNFAKKQGFGSRNGGRIADPATATASATAKEEPQAPPPFSLKADRPERSRVYGLDDAGVAALYQDDRAMDQIIACVPPGSSKRPPSKKLMWFWICSVVPKMRAKNSYRSLARAARSWATRIKPGEFDELNAKASAGEFDRWMKLITEDG